MKSIFRVPHPLRTVLDDTGTEARGSEARQRAFRAWIVVLSMFAATGSQSLRGWGRTWMGSALRLAVEAAKWKIGPLRIDPVLYFTDAGYDTNLYYGSAGDPVKDFTFTAGPGITVYLPLQKTLVFELVESPRYVYYHETKSERTWNNYLNARAHLALNKVFISVGWGLSKARQRWSTEVDLRPRRRETRYEGSLLWQATKKTSFSVQGSRAIYDFENLEYDIFNLRDRLNRTEDRLSFRAYHQLTFRARFFIAGEYGMFRLERQVSSPRDSSSYTVFGGVEFAPLGSVRGRVNVGYKIFRPLDPARSRFKGLSGNSQISVKLTRTLSIRTSYVRDTQFSVWYDNAYFVESRAGGGASLYFFKKLRLDYDYWDGGNRYPESQVLSPGTQIKRRDDYRIHALGLYFRIKGKVGIGLVANRWNRDSNLAYEVDSRDFVGMNLTYDF